MFTYTNIITFKESSNCFHLRTELRTPFFHPFSSKRKWVYRNRIPIRKQRLRSRHACVALLQSADSRPFIFVLMRMRNRRESSSTIEKTEDYIFSLTVTLTVFRISVSDTSTTSPCTSSSYLAFALRPFTRTSALPLTPGSSIVYALF